MTLHHPLFITQRRLACIYTRRTLTEVVGQITGIFTVLLITSLIKPNPCGGIKGTFNRVTGVKLLAVTQRFSDGLPSAGNPTDYVFLED